MKSLIVRIGLVCFAALLVTVAVVVMYHHEQLQVAARLRDASRHGHLEIQEVAVLPYGARKRLPDAWSSYLKYPDTIWLNGDVSQAVLRDLGRLSRIRVVFLKECDEEVLSALVDAKIDTIHVTGARLTDNDILMLARVRGLTGLSLREARLTNINDSIASLRSLRVLDLSGSTLSERVVESVGRLTLIQELRLQGTNFSDEAVSHLKGLQQLEVLDLSRTNITNVSSTDIGRLTRLEVLCLGGTRVTVECLKKFSSLHALKKLEIPEVSDSAVAAVALSALPQLRVVTVLITSPDQVADVEKLASSLHDAVVNAWLVEPDHVNEFIPHGTLFGGIGISTLPASVGIHRLPSRGTSFSVMPHRFGGTPFGVSAVPKVFVYDASGINPLQIYSSTTGHSVEIFPALISQTSHGDPVVLRVGFAQDGFVLMGPPERIEFVPSAEP